MNAHRHRIVFNRHRGQCMAVAETACGGSGRCRRSRLRRTVQAAALCWALLGGSMAPAQVVADPDAASAHRPGVTASANGTPLVQITAPSAAGVSRNVYRRFDVDSAGVILNNSHSDTPTQLGGWVQGNPRLAAGRARAILNEVHSADPSLLSGAIEVAGQRADVIVANPAGIVVNGGRFINAARATLSTGTPVMAHGALERFAVRSGTVRIEGLGLDAADTDHALVLARAIEVNAGAWARQLTAVAGSNDVNDDASRITPASADGTPPHVAIDVAALGGMYAEHIRLVGTEAGLGVNHRGLMSATATLALDAKGWIHNTEGARSLADSVSVNAWGLHNAEGSVIAARSRLAVSAGDIRNTGGALLFSLGDIDLQADNGLENRSATIEALGRLDITAPALLNIDDGLAYRVVTGNSTSRGDYHTAQGFVDSDNLAWTVTQQERANASGNKLLLDTSAYASPAYRGYYLGPMPFVEEHVERLDKDNSNWHPDTFHYDRHSPVWGHFAMAAPGWNAPGESPRPNDHGEVNPEALRQWQTLAAPWLELNQRVAGFKSQVSAQLLPYELYRHYTETSSAVELTASAPARLLSGGDMTLDVAQGLVNQDGHILAGGTLAAKARAVRNLATEASTPTQRSGTLYHFGITGRDCGALGCDPEYGWIASAFQETVARTQPLPTVRHSGQAVLDAPSLGANALTRTVPGSTAPYLIETDPRFTERSRWLSSDHMLGLLGLDVAGDNKRLGDGLLEQRLLREQVAQLTGQRFLGDFGNDEAQYRALMNAGATFARAHGLRPGIALSAEQVAALTSDIVWLEARTVQLPDGRSERVLVPRLYLLPREGDLDAGGALIGARELHLSADGTLRNNGRIAGRHLVRIDADRVEHLGGRIGSEGATAITTREDITVQGARIDAADALVLDAGRDLIVHSTTARGQGSTAHSQGSTRASSEQIDRLARLHIGREAGLLLARAGRDVRLDAARIDSAGGAHMAAGRDLTLGTAPTHSTLDATRDARNFTRLSQHGEAGTQLHAAGDIILQAGQDLHTRAARVQADGDLALQAGRDMNITAGTRELTTHSASFAQGSGLLGGMRSEVRQREHRQDSLASELGGRNVHIQAGQNLQVQGASAIADHGLSVHAARHISVQSATTTHESERFEAHRQSGVFASGAGLTLGSQQHSTRQDTRQTQASASTLGAVAGDVNITAGARYSQTGSDVLAPGGDVRIDARDIAITEARETQHSRSEQRFQQSGIIVGVSAPLLTAAQGTLATASALGKTDDPRTQALGAATLALQGLQLYDGAAKLAEATNPTQAGKVGVNIGLGSSRSESVTESRSDSARESTVMAGGDVLLTARGATTTPVRPEPVEGPPSTGSILVQGSDIRAGHTARLKAEGDITLQAARNRAEEHSRNESRSSSVGVGIGAGGRGVEYGLTASASRSQGEGDGQETTQRNAHLDAGQLIVLASGGDTTLQGAVARAERIEARVGGDLRIQSVQDTASYTEQQKNAGASVTVGTGSGGSLSAGKTKIESAYASVAEQSALRAGDGGFDVQVQGHTALVGGALTSTERAAQAGLNALGTATLSSDDIDNHAHTDVSSSGFQLSSDMLTQGKYGVAKRLLGNALSNADESSASQGMTRATVSGAAIHITDEAAQPSLTGQTPLEAVAALNRDANAAHTAVRRPEVQTLKERVEAERAIRHELIQAITALTDEAYRSRMEAKPKLLRVECPAGQDCDKDRSLLVYSAATKEEFAASGQPSILAVNGILNGEQRAAELAYQNTELVFDLTTKKWEKPGTVYLMHIAPADNTLSELLGVAYEKIVASADYGLANFLGYTRGDEFKAELLRLRGDQATLSLGHSRGTLVQEAAFTILANRPDQAGNAYTNPNLSVRGVGGAAEAQAYTDKGGQVIGDPRKLDQVSFSYFSNDPVSTSALAGGNPGVWTLSDLWQVFKTNNSMHSCYGTGAAGCTQVERPMPGGPQGTPEGNARLIKFVGGKRVELPATQRTDGEKP